MERVVFAKLEGLRELIDERDAKYTERAHSSEKAIEKAEHAQGQYNQTHNDLLRKMDEQMPRKEIEARFTAMEEKIDNLQGGNQLRTGRDHGISLVWGIIIAVIASVPGLVAFVSMIK